MSDRIEKISESVDNDGAGNKVVTRAVSHDSSDQQVNKAAQIVWFIVGIIVALLAVRVVLALVGANLENAFASFIYTLSEPFVAPFRGLLQIGQFEAGVSRLELETIVAAAIYVVIGWGIASAIRLAQKN